MRITFLLLLLASSLYSQNKNDLSNFSVTKENKIKWTKIFKSTSEPLKNLQGNLLLKFNSDSTGTASSLKLRCKALSIYCKENFTVDFRIERKQGAYKVNVTNIVFDNSVNYNLGAVMTANKNNNIEDFALKNIDNSIRTNNQTMRNLKCLDEYFTTLFSLEESKKW